MAEKVLAFDVETRRLASEVAEEHADALDGASPWSRPDLFGFAVGVVIDLCTDVAYRYRDAAAMLGHLREADSVVSYNAESFDLGVLSAHGDVSSIRQKHLDINVLVMEALDALPIDLRGGDRIRQGGLDGLARANGLSGKTGSGVRAPELLRAGKVEEVLDYCEADARLVAELYRVARRTGSLLVDGYVKSDGERVGLGRLEVPTEIPRTNPEAVGSYEHEFHGEQVTIELWRPADFAEHVREEAPSDAVCGAAIASPDLDYLVFHAEQHDDELSMIPLWAEGERQAFVAAKLLGVGVLDSRVPGLFWLRNYPKDAPEALVRKLREKT